MSTYSRSRSPSPLAGERERFRSDDEDDRGSIRSDEDRRDRERSDGEDRDKDKGRNSDEEEERREKEKQKRKLNKPKGPVKRQMISEDMLTGKNGLCKLSESFEGFTFGGKGKAKEDLNRVLNKIEQWVHTLHPKYPFDQCLERIEFLGMKKKSIKTYQKKMRMGMLNGGGGGTDEVVQLFDDDDLPMFENEEHPPEGRAAATSQSQEPDPSEFPDMDDLEQMEMEARLFGGSSSSNVASQPPTAPTATISSNINADDFPEDDDFPSMDDLELLDMEITTRYQINSTQTPSASASAPTTENVTDAEAEATHPSIDMPVNNDKEPNHACPSFVMDEDLPSD